VGTFSLSRKCGSRRSTRAGLWSLAARSAAAKVPARNRASRDASSSGARFGRLVARRARHSPPARRALPLVRARVDTRANERESRALVDASRRGPIPRARFRRGRSENASIRGSDDHDRDRDRDAAAHGGDAGRAEPVARRPSPRIPPARGGRVLGKRRRDAALARDAASRASSRVRSSD